MEPHLADVPPRAQDAVLAPCPFCRHPHPQVVELDLQLWAAMCPSCLAIGPQALTPFQARGAWNLRHPQQAG